ncbi:hypothetical protein HK405_005111, partial [Cladochytrium tenue]
MLVQCSNLTSEQARIAVLPAVYACEEDRAFGLAVGASTPTTPTDSPAAATAARTPASRPTSSPTSPGPRSPASSPAAAASEDRRRAEVWAGSLSSLLGGAGDQLGAGWVPVYIGDASLQDNRAF